MALTNGTVSVGTAATQVNGSNSNPVILHIHNNDNSDAMYLGSESVTTNDGMQLLKLESLTITLNQGERLYAVSTKAGHILSYIQQTL